MNQRKEIVRFLGAGTLVTLTDFSIYYLLFHFLSYGVSKGISFTCAGILGYLVNKYWTFKHKKTSFAEIGRYWFINMLALGINVLINQGILNTYPKGILLALILATVATGLFSYICFKWWVFKS